MVRCDLRCLHAGHTAANTGLTPPLDFRSKRTLMKSLAEAKQFIRDNNVKYILAQFVDIHGVAKVKSVPSGHLEDILTGGAGFAGGAIWGMGIEPNGPDYMAVGELSTLSLIPWQPGYARII